MPVTFESQRLTDFNLPLTLENMFQYYAAYSGIHDFLFDDLFSSDSISYTGVTASEWTRALQSVVLPTSYSVAYSKTVARQGIMVGVNSSLIGYNVCTDSSGVYIYHSGILKLSIPIVTPETADVLVSFRQVRYSDREDDLWRVITLWMNDKLVVSYSEPADVVIESPLFGFAAYDTDAVTYTNVRIPELTEFAEWGTLDPGEESLGGLRRVIEGRYLKFFVRYDGSLRAWRPKSVSEAHAFDADDIYEGKVNLDISQLASHIRMVGAYTWAEAIDAELLQKYEHRFQELNNPMLMTEEECYLEALRSLRRIREATNAEQLRTPFTPLLEPEDRVSTTNGDWLISDISQQFVSGDVVQNLTVKEYVWD